MSKLGGQAFSGMASYDRRLTWGPNGYVWLYIRDSQDNKDYLSYINPLSGEARSLLNSR